MAMGIFEQLDWLTKRVKRLCCAVDKIKESGAGSYKVFTATITQSGSNPPVATVFQDDFNGAFTFLYNDTGQYVISSTDEIFTENKTYLTIGQYALHLDGQGTFRNSFYWNSTTDLRIQTQVNGGPSFFLDDVLVNIPIEIRVYN